LHVQNVNELIGRALRAVRAERLIGELHERHLIVRRLHHAIELGLLATFLRRLQRASAAAELARECEGLLDFEGDGWTNETVRFVQQLPNILLNLLRRFGGIAWRHDNELSRNLAGSLPRFNAMYRLAVALNRERSLRMW
jgi:hypothetical protein